MVSAFMPVPKSLIRRKGKRAVGVVTWMGRVCLASRCASAALVAYSRMQANSVLEYRSVSNPINIAIDFGSGSNFMTCFTPPRRLSTTATLTLFGIMGCLHLWGLDWVDRYSLASPTLHVKRMV